MTVRDPDAATFGTWQPAYAHPGTWEVYDVLMYRGLGVGVVEGFGQSFYGHVMGIRLGAYAKLSEARADVEEYAALAKPFLDKITSRGE